MSMSLPLVTSLQCSPHNPISKNVYKAGEVTSAWFKPRDSLFHISVKAIPVCGERQGLANNRIVAERKEVT